MASLRARDGTATNRSYYTYNCLVQWDTHEGEQEPYKLALKGGQYVMLGITYIPLAR